MNNPRIPGSVAKTAVKIRVESLLARCKQRSSKLESLLKLIDSDQQALAEDPCQAELDALNAAIVVEAAAEIVHDDALADYQAAEQLYEAAQMATTMAAMDYEDCLNNPA